MKKFDIYDIFIRLATAPRRGWVMRGIKNPETTYQHSLEMKLMALKLGPFIKGLNVNRAAEMCMIHDLTDGFYFDVTPSDGLTPEQKKRHEQEGIDELMRQVKPRDRWLLAQMVALWHEYEDRKSPEARFVKELDLLQMGSKIVYYERTQGKNLSKMWEDVDKGVSTPCLRDEFEALALKRPDDLANRPLTLPHKLSPQDELFAQERAIQVFRDAPNAEMDLCFERYRASQAYPNIIGTRNWFRAAGIYMGMR